MIREWEGGAMSDEITVWTNLNGRLVRSEEAMIPVWDRGFLFGDAIFEAIRVHNGRAVLWGVHMLRLKASARGVLIDNIPGDDVLLERAIGLIEKSGLESGTIYLQISRGNVGKRSDVEMPTEPTVFISLDAHTSLSEEKYEMGVEVITFEDIRWKYAGYKTTNLLPRTLARIEGNRLGAHEVLFRHPDGRVFEGTSTNLFMVKDGVLTTPPLSDRLLPGATRAALLSLARKVVKATREADITVSDLLDADEVILSGTNTEALGVVSVDGQQVCKGLVGPVAKALRKLYWTEVLEKA